MKFLSEGLSKPNNKITINFSMNKLSNEFKLKFLCECISKLTNSEEINLSKNNFGLRNTDMKY